MKSAMMAKGPDKNVQSGNSRVKVTIYGWVNRAVRFASSGGKSDIHSVDNDESVSRFGIRAVGKLNANTSAVALSEWGMSAGGGRYGTGFSDDGAQGSGGTVGVRHSLIDIVNKDLGTVSLGHSIHAHGPAIYTGFTAAGLTFNIGTTGTGLVPNSDKMVAEGRIGMPGNVGLGGRQNRILYKTPNLMGVGMQVSYTQAKSYSAGISFSSPASMSKDISIALGAGYRHQPNAGMGGGDINSFGVSGGVKHNASGFSVNGAYTQALTKAGMTMATPMSRMVGSFLTTADNPATDDDESAYTTGVMVTSAKAAARTPGSKHTAWMANVSWTGKLMEAGATGLTIGYASYKKGDYSTTTNYWVGVHQNVDSAAADVYFGVSYDTGNGAYTVAHEAGTATDLAAVGSVDGTTGVYTPPALDANATFDTTCGASSWDATLDPDGDGTAEGGVAGVQNGAKCSVARDGVLVVLGGIRVKF
ncbi:MAG: hypothetical protein OXM58_13660 [Rhodospirillaceae bacterium]|nr:hypothetical protein [Rhodospirillaceae bacterium]MDE0617713.1 hypothetical protein [Rhodospirillaceae bacterium]